jgi:hypothetical protein
MPYTPQTGDLFGVPTPETGRHYRWLSTRPEKLSGWLRSFGTIPGYRLERGATLDRTKERCTALGLPVECVNEATNRIEFGFNVLASIPLEEHERRTSEKRSIERSREGQVEDSFRATIDRVPGATARIDVAEEFEARKQHAVREDRPFSGQSGTDDSPQFRRRRAPRAR